MTAFVMACCVFGLMFVIVWGVFEGERDRAERARDRQLRREARNVKGSE